MNLKSRSDKFYYPAFLDLSGKNILVVGGGKVAQRKIKTLIKYKPNILVVAKILNSEVKKLARLSAVQIQGREFQAADLNGMDLVFCATNDATLNQSVSEACKKRKIWVNVADQTALCGFIVPSIIQRGAVSIAISTGGFSPALAKFLRKKIEKAVPPKFGAAAEALKKHRKEIIKIPLTRRKRMINKILEVVDHGNP